MKKKRLATAFLIFGFAAPAAFGQGSNAPPAPENARFGNPTAIARNIQGSIYGVIKKLGADEIVLDKTKFGVDQTIKLEKKTKYIRDGKRSAFADLKEGDPVYVDAKKDKKTGDLIAKKIVSGIIAAP